MATVNIATPFTLTRDDGRPLEIAAGVQGLDDDLASHWYVQLHAVPVPEEPAPVAKQKAK